MLLLLLLGMYVHTCSACSLDWTFVDSLAASPFGNMFPDQKVNDLGTTSQHPVALDKFAAQVFFVAITFKPGWAGSGHHQQGTGSICNGVSVCSVSHFSQSKVQLCH